MAKTQTYRMDVGNEKGEYFQASSPNKALRLYWGDKLADSSGRYGHLFDGRLVVALLSHGGATRYADHGTTRELGAVRDYVEETVRNLEKHGF